GHLYSGKRGPAAQVPTGEAPVSRDLAQIALDPEKRVAEAKPLMRGGLARLAQLLGQKTDRLHKLAPGMRPTPRENHVRHPVVTDIAIHLQETVKPRQKSTWMEAPARGLILIQHDRRSVAPGTIEPHVGFGFRRPPFFFQ